MAVELLIGVSGSFVSLLLLVNAHFTRKTLEKITDVELKLAVLIAKHDTTEERSKHNEDEIQKLREEVLKLRERMHSVEGSNAQVLEHIRNN